MKCCPQCFKDRIARELVGNLASSVPGICDLCGVERDRLLTIARESELSEQFFDLLSSDDGIFINLHFGKIANPLGKSAHGYAVLFGKLGQ